MRYQIKLLEYPFLRAENEENLQNKLFHLFTHIQQSRQRNAAHRQRPDRRLPAEYVTSVMRRLLQTICAVHSYQ